jgi:hypothetical protein
MASTTAPTKCLDIVIDELVRVFVTVAILVLTVLPVDQLISCRGQTRLEQHIHVHKRSGAPAIAVVVVIAILRRVSVFAKFGEQAKRVKKQFALRTMTYAFVAIQNDVGNVLKVTT